MQGVSQLLIAEPIVHCAGEILLASDVSFSALNGRMSQQELDLLQLAACGMAQPRAGMAAALNEDVRFE